MRVFYVRCSTIEQNEARQLKMAEEQMRKAGKTGKYKGVRGQSKRQEHRPRRL